MSAASLATTVSAAQRNQMSAAEVDLWASCSVGPLVLLLLGYDVALLLACLRQKNDDAAIAVPYAFTYALFAVVEKVAFLFNSILYLSSKVGYEFVMRIVGQCVTFVSHLSHFGVFSVCLLITFHRCCIIRDPRHQLFFPHSLVYPYILLALVPVLAVVLISMLLSECPLLFHADTFSPFPQFAACPQRAPDFLALLISQLAAFVAFLSFTINSVLLVHGKLVLAGFYRKLACAFGMGNKVTPFVIDAVPPQVRVQRKKRHAAMRQMTCSMSAFLLATELLRWPIEAFEPDYSPSLPRLHQALSYLYFFVFSLLNVVVFSVSTTATNNLLGQYCGLADPYVTTQTPTNIIHVASIRTSTL